MTSAEAKGTFDVVIASGATASEAFPTYGYRLLAVETPAALTGTALALHGANHEAATYKPLVGSGGAVSVTAAASQIVQFGELCLTPWMKIVSNGAEAAARTFRVYLGI